MNDTDRRLHNKQDSKNGELLDLDGGQQRSGLRKDKAQAGKVLYPSIDVPQSGASDNEEGRHTTHLRQSEMRQAGSPEGGNSERKHSGYAQEGKISERQGEPNPLQQSRTSVNNDEVGKEVLQDVPLQSKERKSEETNSGAARQNQSSSENQSSQAKAISLSERTGEIVAKDSSELMRQIGILMKGNAFPVSMDTPAKCIAAWNLACSFKGVSPQRAISNMMYIGNVLSIWGELPKALAEATGEIEDYELYLVDEDYNVIIPENKNLKSDPFAAICKIKRRGRTKNTYFFTTSEAEKAGLLRKRGPWQDYAKIMLKRRAQGEGLKFEFSDALMGANIAEYQFNHFPEIKDVSPQIREGRNVANELNDLFPEDQPIKQ